MTHRVRKVSVVIAVLVLLLLLYAVGIEPNSLFVKKHVIYDKGLAEVLQGKTIVHLSDLHINRVGYREKKLVEKVNALDPDLIFITGEYIGDGNSKEVYSKKVKAAASVLKKLKARYGIWGVLGEGDIYPNERLGYLLNTLRDSNVNILRNESISIPLDEKKLNVIGIGIQLSGRKKVLQERSSEGAHLVLSHFPNILSNSSDALVVNLEEPAETGNNGWGWQDNAVWTRQTGEVFFENDGWHSLRVQRREDGVSVDQILLTPQEKFKPGLGETVEPCIEISPGDVLIYAKDIEDKNIHGSWKKRKDSGACKGIKVADEPDRGYKVQIPLTYPEHYFDISFQAKKTTKYHVWFRMKAKRDSTSSDSLYAQFSDSLDESGNEVYRLGALLQPEVNINLVLAGDTHGGQVRIPFWGPVLNLFGKRLEYDKGFFRTGEALLYVNSGVGWSSFPIRFMCPPEITVFKFVSP